MPPSQAVRFIPNPAGILALGKSVGVLAALDVIGEAIVEGAKTSAPERTGDYKDGIVVRDGKTPGTKEVAATDFKSSWIEFGTEKWGAHAPLRQGADAAGIPLVGGRKGEE